MKKLFLSLLLALCISTMGSSAFAAKYASVDLNKIIKNYSKAQEISAELKTKENAIKEFAEEARKEINSTTLDTEKELLKQKYSAELKEKQNAYNEEYKKLLSSVEKDIMAAVDDVAKEKGLKLILNKSSIVYGSRDITTEVITNLNGK